MYSPRSHATSCKGSDLNDGRLLTSRRGDAASGSARKRVRGEVPQVRTTRVSGANEPGERSGAIGVPAREPAGGVRRGEGPRSNQVRPARLERATSWFVVVAAASARSNRINYDVL